MSVKNSKLFELFTNCKGRPAFEGALLREFKFNINEPKRDEARAVINKKNLYGRIAAKWQNVHRSKDHFRKKYASWLAMESKILNMEELGPKNNNIMPTGPIKYTSEEALTLLTDLELSHEQYEILRNSLKRHNVNILPAYKQAETAKHYMTPPSTGSTDPLAI